MNTLQLVLATEGNKTFVMFLYQDIQWVGDASSIGFDTGEERFYNLPESFDSTRILNLENTSNVGSRGTYIFRVDQADILLPNSTYACSYSGTSI